tara:strand:+ start:477 stop:611 length:135 start_codon:yes stop_codon:yes gene_type:complete
MFEFFKTANQKYIFHTDPSLSEEDQASFKSKYLKINQKFRTNII